jgi:hypothetical protein
MTPSPETPDTTEAVGATLSALMGHLIQAMGDEEVIDPGALDPEPYRAWTVHLLAADRKALADQGYAIVKVGEVPPWMEPWGFLKPDFYQLRGPRC